MRNLLLVSTAICGVLATFEADADLNAAVSATTPSIREYIMDADETISTALGNMGGSQLTIEGQDLYSITSTATKGLKINVLASDTLNINNVLNVSNFSETGDGAFVVNSGTTNVNNSNFSDNSASGAGGVFRNLGTSGGQYADDIYININESEFKNNTGGSYGSAVLSNSGVASITKSIFSNNMNGVLGNLGKLSIFGSSFENNGVNAAGTGNTGSSSGGAIRTHTSGMVYINYSTDEGVAVDDTLITKFEGNYTTNGGAIHNSASLFIKNATFKNNKATANGGAIYNNTNGKIDILGGTQNVLFSGNTSGSVSNAIYNLGTVNFDAGVNKVTSYDMFGGVYNATTGTGIYNLKSGTLELLEANAGFESTTRLAISDGTKISTIDNEINTTSLGNILLNGNVNYGLDVEVNGTTGQGDKLTGSVISGSGSIVIDEINVMGSSIGSEIAVNLKEATGGLFGSISLSRTETITSGFDADAYDATTGVLTLIRNTNLKEVVNLDSPSKTYTLTDPESVSLEIGNMLGQTLSITGSGNDVIAANVGGIIMGDNQTITLNNFGEVKGFDGSFISAGNSTININSDSTNTSTFSSGISGNANIVINSGTSNTGAVIFATATEANTININNGTTTFNGAVNANNITNEGTAIFNNNVTASITNNADIETNNAIITGAIAGSGSITSTGTTSFVNGVIENDITINSGTTTFSGSTIDGAVLSTSNITTTGVTSLTSTGSITSNSAFANTGTFNVNGAFATTGVITNTGGIFNLNSNMTLSNTFSGGAFNLADGKVLALSGTNADFSDTAVFSAESSTINSSVDDAIYDYNLGQATLTNTSINLDMELNFNDGSIDSDAFLGSVTGSVIINEINMNSINTAQNVSGASGFIDIFASTSNVVVNPFEDTTTFTIMGQTYNLHLTSGTNRLEYSLASATNTLKTAVNSIILSKQYDMSANEVVTENLGTLEGEHLVINGNNKNITTSGLGISGIVLGAGKTLTLNNVAEVSDFNGDFVYATGGTININADENVTTTLSSGINTNGNLQLNINKEATDVGKVIFNSITSAENITISNGSVTFNSQVSSDIANNATLNINAAKINGDITGTGSIITTGITSFNGDVTNSSVLINSDSINFNGSIIDANISGAGSVIANGNNTFEKNVNNTTVNVNGGQTTFKANVNAAVVNAANVIFDNAIVNGVVSGSGLITTNANTTFNSSVTTGGLTNTNTLNVNNALTVNGAITNTGGVFNLDSSMTLTNMFNGGEFNLFDNNILSLSGVNADFSNVTIFNAANSTINTTADNTIVGYNLGQATLNNTNIAINLLMDASNGTITNDTFSGIVTGSANLSDIEISYINSVPSQGIDGVTGFIDIFVNGSSDVDVTSTVDSSKLSILTNTYTLYLTGDTNGLSYELFDKNNTLQTAIASLRDPRIYIMSNDEEAGTNNMVGNLTIDGQGNTVSSGTINMQTDSVLNLKDVNVAAEINGSGETINITGNDVYEYSGRINYANINLDSNIIRSEQDSNVSYTLNSGVLKYTNDAYLNGGNSLDFNGGSLNLINDAATNISLNTLILNKNANLYLDVYLDSKTMDSIDATTVVQNNSSMLNIKELYIRTHHATEFETDVVFSTNQEIIDITSYVGDASIETTALSPIYIYDVLYDDGVFTFKRQGGDEGFNSAVQKESVSNQTIYNTNIDFAKQMLATVDAYSEIQGRSTGDETTPKVGGAWVKVYGSDEDVDLGNFKVDSKTYAGVLGVDSDAQYYDNGLRGIYSAYLAYLNSEQSYDDVNITQDGVNVGIRAMFDKGNWYAGAIANLGFNMIEGHDTVGKEDFETYTASVSVKTGYDINLYCKQYVLQPNITASYLYAYTPNYTNASDLRIRSDALHAFNINPEVKFIAHLDNGYSPYASVGYNWNIEAGGEVKADNVALPDLSVDPYAEFKLGASRKFDDEISGYAEISITTGGREGYTAQAGIKWEF